MNLLDYIEKARQKPEGERRKIAFLIALIFTAIIVGIWLTLVLFGPSSIF